MEPEYKHNCPGCTYLNTIEQHSKVYDLYYCTPSQVVGPGTVVVRKGNEPSDYLMGTEFAGFNPLLSIAAIHAIAKDLLSIEELKWYIADKI